MRFPLWIFFLIPFTEILVFIEVGKIIGGINTVALVLLSLFAGITIIRQQGFKAVLKARQHISVGEATAIEMLEGFIIAIGGLLMIIPGFITSTIGLSLIISPIRKLALKKMLHSGRWKVQQPNDTYEGEFHREDIDLDKGIGRTIDGEFRRERKDKW